MGASNLGEAVEWYVVFCVFVVTVPGLFLAWGCVGNLLHRRHLLAGKRLFCGVYGPSTVFVVVPYVNGDRVDGVVFRSVSCIDAYLAAAEAAAGDPEAEFRVFQVEEQALWIMKREEVCWNGWHHWRTPHFPPDVCPPWNLPASLVHSRQR
jgi:hypothetical protein